MGLSGNHVRDLAPLSALTNVRRLDLYYTSVSDLSPLKGLTKMKTLHLYGAPLSDLSPLLGMSDLRGAGLSDTLVSDLSPLVGMERMQVLQLNGTCVSDLSPLSAMTEMLFLELVETRVSDLTPLASMNKVTVELVSSQNVTVPPNFKGRIQRPARRGFGQYARHSRRRYKVIRNAMTPRPTTLAIQFVRVPETATQPIRGPLAVDRSGPRLTLQWGLNQVGLHRSHFRCEKQLHSAHDFQLRASCA